jgi:hypothetical protein
LSNEITALNEEGNLQIKQGGTGATHAAHFVQRGTPAGFVSPFPGSPGGCETRPVMTGTAA